MSQPKIYGIQENKCLADITNGVIIHGDSNTALGNRAMETITSEATSQNVAVGAGAGNSLEDANTSNVLVGPLAGGLLKSNYNVAIGDLALSAGYANGTNAATGSGNIAVGYGALNKNTTGDGNVVIGKLAMVNKTSGSNNVAIGANTLHSTTALSLNTALGYNSLHDNAAYSNCTGVGANTVVTAENQVQLGDSATAVYAYSALNNRSDSRDKADIEDTKLGLEFINKIRPVEFKWDIREDYNEVVEKKDKKGNVTGIKTIKHKKDGSKKRSRAHQGVIAQEVKQVMDELNVDFAGYQDHSISGGEDVLTIGYTEFIAPLIKAVQELSKNVIDLEDKVNELQAK